MKTILNLTMHTSTPEQAKKGVVDLAPDLKDRLVEELNFENIPGRMDIVNSACNIGMIVINQCDRLKLKPSEVGAMIGGAPFLMKELHETLEDISVDVLYAFSKRIVKEEIMTDFTVQKKSVFVFEGFVSCVKDL